MDSENTPQPTSEKEGPDQNNQDKSRLLNAIQHEAEDIAKTRGTTESISLDDWLQAADQVMNVEEKGQRKKVNKQWGLAALLVLVIAILVVSAMGMYSSLSGRAVVLPGDTELTYETLALPEQQAVMPVQDGPDNHMEDLLKKLDQIHENTAQYQQVIASNQQVIEELQEQVSVLKEKISKKSDGKQKEKMSRPVFVPPMHPPVSPFRHPPVMPPPLRRSVKAPVKTPVNESSKVTSAVIPKSLHNHKWIRQQSGSHYTLQLVSVSKQSSLARFVKEYKLDTLGEPLAYLNINSRYSLIYGSFPNKSAALRASVAVRQRVPGIKPWTRPFGSLKKYAKL
jgi:septal ring-binding cell division protein DamX